MDEIYKDNFLDAVKGAEKSIYKSCLVSITLYGLALLKKIETITLPIIDLQIEGSAGLLILLLLYTALGVQLCLYGERANKNLASLTNVSMKKALVQYPSIACGSAITRIMSALLPVAVFSVAMNKGFDGNFPLVTFMTGIFSTPYIVAIPTIYQIKE